MSDDLIITAAPGNLLSLVCPGRSAVTGAVSDCKMKMNDQGHFYLYVAEHTKIGPLKPGEMAALKRHGVEIA